MSPRRDAEATLDPPDVDELLGHLGALPGPSSGRPELARARHEGLPVVVKYGSGRARGPLRREAEVLARVGGQGVVELIEVVDRDPLTALVLADAGHRTLREPDELAPEVLLRSLRHTARVVASLHARGWYHGDLRPDHVVVGPRGRVRLCSLGVAGPVGGADDTRSDVGALVALVAHAAEACEAAGRRRTSRRLRRLHSELVASAALGASEVGDALDRLCRGDRSVGGGWPPELPDGVGRVARRGAFALLLLAGAAFAVAPSRPPDPRAAPPESRVSGTTVEAGPTSPPELAAPSGPTVTLDGVTYRVGLAGDVAVVGDRDCGGSRTVWVLRPATGEVFAFDELPARDGRVAGRVVAVVPGATELAVRPGGGAGGGCDGLVARTPDGAEVEVT